MDAQVVLARLPDATELLRPLLDEGQSTRAGRLIGALRQVGRPRVADDIASAMKAAGHVVRERNPFWPVPHLARIPVSPAPVVARRQSLWQRHRNAVADLLPPAPGLPRSSSAYLRTVDAGYSHDAYHSLAIEGYRGTPSLVNRVRDGGWNAEIQPEDRQTLDALAASGYWLAFQAMKRDVATVFSGAGPQERVRPNHRAWHRALFQPSVAAGLIRVPALASYRHDAVFIRGTRHLPPRREAVRDAMPALFDLLEQEHEPAVRAVLGHWLFGYVHPFPDGNGRLARFLMNIMLASRGYPWTAIRVEDRASYMAALEAASVDSDIKTFARFVAVRVERSMAEVRT